MKQSFLIFHLNLAFSSIPEEKRQTVIHRCYYPLLELVEKLDIPIGIELSSWTLQQILALEPQWIVQFKTLLDAGRCELIGSGHTQLIGPLAPWQVNEWNQRLGLAGYRHILNTRPTLALVNEMAFSSGLVPLYQNAGYSGIIMDRDNIRLAMGLEQAGYDAVPTHALGPAGEKLPILWSDSILFQKLQRFAHNEIGIDDYLAYYRKRSASSIRPLAVYCNDAEIFDFRPGRFAEEALPQSASEWNRIAELLRFLQEHEDTQWLSPSAALAASVSATREQPRRITSIHQPIPVKKQIKYNLARWAVSGRNNLWINSQCHRIFQYLVQQENNSEDDWRRLCELWASDLRTHITEDRWRATLDIITGLLEQREPDKKQKIETAESLLSTTPPENWNIRYSDDGIFLSLTTNDIQITFNLRRGLTIHRLGFRSHSFEPLIGTLPHGYFESIEYGADFYSGGVIIELPCERQKITDLHPVTPDYGRTNKELVIRAIIHTSHGPIIKYYLIPSQGEALQLKYEFPGWSKPMGIIRLGSITLIPESFLGDLQLSCRNGGKEVESFLLDQDCDHTQPSSYFVSSTTGFGATDGEICIGTADRQLSLQWNPAHASAMPMLIHRTIHPGHLTRLKFSLAELDDTARPEGVLLGFHLSIQVKR